MMSTFSLPLCHPHSSTAEHRGRCSYLVVMHTPSGRRGGCFSSVRTMPQLGLCHVRYWWCEAIWVIHLHQRVSFISWCAIWKSTQSSRDYGILSYQSSLSSDNSCSPLFKQICVRERKGGNLHQYQTGLTKSTAWWRGKNEHSKFMH